MSNEMLDVRQKKAVGLIVARDVNGYTLEEIAKEVGVSTTTLYTWRKDYHFRKYLNEQADAIVSTYLTDAYRSLGQILRNPNSHDRDKINASKELIRLQGKYKDTVEVEPSNNMMDLLEKLDKM